MHNRIILAIALLSLPLCAIADNTTLAKVNGDPVTAQDIVDLFSDRHSGHAKFLGGNAEAREFLKIVIDDRLLVQEAYEIGLDKDPAVVQLSAELERTRAESLLIKTEIEAKAKPAPDQVREIWKSLTFVMKVRQFAVGTKQEADELRVAILGGADMDAFARDCSRAESRVHGGHIVVRWGQMEPQWESVVFALQPGEVSPVIATRGGFEVVFVENRIDTERPPFEKVSQQIEGALLQRNLERRKKEFSDELWAKYHVVLHDGGDVVATWDGGKLTRDEALTEKDLRPTINAPLLALEIEARHVADDPSIAEEVRKYREYLMESVLFRDHIFKDLDVADEEMQRYYDAHKNEFEAAEQRHVAQVLLSNEKDAANVRQRLAGGTDFETAVKKFSKDPISAMNGGDLGWITPDKVPAAFKSVLAMSAGDVSKPIQSPGGWHLIKVTEIKPKRQLTFDEVKEKVRKSYLEVKKQAARTRWVEKLRAASKIEIDDAAIQKFVKANEFSGTPPPQHSY